VVPPVKLNISVGITWLDFVAREVENRESPAPNQKKIYLGVIMFCVSFSFPNTILPALANVAVTKFIIICSVLNNRL